MNILNSGKKRQNRLNFPIRLAALLLRIVLCALCATYWESLSSPDVSSSALFLVFFLENLIERLALEQIIRVGEFLRRLLGAFLAR